MVERMWPTCIGLATFGELKSMTDGARLRGFLKKQMFAACSGLKCLDHCGWFQPEIQEARPGDFRFFAKLRNIEFRQHVAWQAGAD